MAKQQFFTIKVSPKYNKETRQAIAREVIDYIIDRTQKKNLDKDNKPFPKYSKTYTESLEFKIANKKKGKVDLTLTSEMLYSLKHLKGMDENGKIAIGYDGRSDALNGKVEGNRIGSYGQKTGKKSKARDFLGIKKEDLNKILDKYPTEDKRKLLERVKRATEIQKAAEERVNQVEKRREEIEKASK